VSALRRNVLVARGNVSRQRRILGAEYGIVNTEERSVLLIEDDAAYEGAIQRMLTAGVRVVWPGHGF